MGFEIGNMILTEKTSGFFLIVVATLIFDGFLTYAKHLVFRRYKTYIFVALYEGTDFFALLIATIVVLVLAVLGENIPNDFSPISLSLLSWSGVITVFLNFGGQYAYFRDRTKAKNKDAPVQNIIIKILISILKVLLFMIISIGAVFIMVIFFLPVEEFDLVFQAYSPEVGRFFFIQASLFWVAFLTGIMYIVLPARDVKKIPLPTNQTNR
ncbi:MAG: hypothetical protein GY755_15760 [Chloroflexi bacterium]|nr:hypothetical protein [Chloroflexota bacterium]